MTFFASLWYKKASLTNLSYYKNFAQIQNI